MRSLDGVSGQCHSSPSGVEQIYYKFGLGFQLGIRRHVFDDPNSFACNGHFLEVMIGKC